MPDTPLVTTDRTLRSFPGILTVNVCSWPLVVALAVAACGPATDRPVTGADSLASPQARAPDVVRDARAVSTTNPGYPNLGPSTATDTGRTLYTGVSAFSVITGRECPGRHIVNARLQEVRDLIVRITEDNTSYDCHEGTRSLLTATVWRGEDTASMTTIRAVAAAGAIILPLSNEDSEPLLLQAWDEGCCGSADDYTYWDLRTGRLSFTAEKPIVRFIASGRARYLAVGGGRHDTIAFVQYGDGRREPQRIAVMVPGYKGYTQVDSTTIAGPRSWGGYAVVGQECCVRGDTVAVSGVAMRLYPVADDGSAGFEVLINIVNDRIQLGSVMRRP